MAGQVLEAIAQCQRARPHAQSIAAACVMRPSLLRLEANKRDMNPSQSTQVLQNELPTAAAASSALCDALGKLVARGRR